MIKNILNLEGAQKLTNEEQKSINGGIGAGPCVNSNKVCTNTGNAGCPRGQGCFLFDDDITPAYALCMCL